MDGVDKIKPRVGTIALKNGLGPSAWLRAGKSMKMKNKTITMYVKTAIKTLRNKLVSHALSASTRARCVA
ncbi:MAG: hypothetical protein PHY72_03640 [Candidatus Pacebacteria bacterium]|nr:hypothetical protein [Candidatus Paceibacterota bacterium]